MEHFNQYQKHALMTAMYPNIGQNIIYPALGLTGEAGEVSELVKKMIRDDGGQLTELRREKLLKELGDVLWYVAVVAHEAGLMLGDVAQVNLDKLSRRKEEGKITGSGSDR